MRKKLTPKEQIARSYDKLKECDAIIHVGFKRNPNRIAPKIIVVAAMKNVKKPEPEYIGFVRIFEDLIKRFVKFIEPLSLSTPGELQNLLENYLKKKREEEKW